MDLTNPQIIMRDKEIARLKEELAKEREKVKELSTWLDDMEAEARDFAFQVERKTEQLAAAQATIEQMREYFDLIKQRFCGWHTVAEEALAQPASIPEDLATGRMDATHTTALAVEKRNDHRN